MNDAPELEAREDTGTYRICTACQCRVHKDLERCPECGAYPGEHFPSRHLRKFDHVLKFLLVLFMAASLYLLSRNREEARQVELTEITRLSPSGSNGIESEEGPDTSGGTDTPETAPFGSDPFSVPDPSPTPTPSEVVTPARITRPVPTETPLPLPTATPSPVPTPTMAPPTPTPTPPPTILDEKEKVKQELSEALDQQAPVVTPGDTVTLTRQNGQQITGTLLQSGTRQFKFETETGSQWIPYNQLNLQSRLRVDTKERDAFLEEKALEQILNRL